MTRIRVIVDDEIRDAHGMTTPEESRGSPLHIDMGDREVSAYQCPVCMGRGLSVESIDHTYWCARTTKERLG